MLNQQLLTDEMDRLRKFALRLTHNVDDADDLLQSTLVRAMEKKHLFKTDSNVYSWVSKVMYNLFVSQYRRKVKFETQYDPEIYLARETVPAAQEETLEVKRVARAMKQLSEKYRNVLILVCVKGMTYEDAAGALDVPVGTVRSRLSRAREMLQSLVEGLPDHAQRQTLKSLAFASAA